MRIRFTVSEKGRKALVTAGKPSRETQSIEVPVGDPCFAALLEHAHVDSQGRATLDATKNWFSKVQAFDSIPSSAEILAELRRAEQEKAREEAEQEARREAERQERAAAVERFLVDRPTRTETRTVEVEVDATKATANYEEKEPDDRQLPWEARRMLHDRPDFQNWLAVLEKENSAAKKAAEDRAMLDAQAIAKLAKETQAVTDSIEIPEEAAENKRKLLELARQGKPRPRPGTKLGDALIRYTTPQRGVFQVTVRAVRVFQSRVCLEPVGHGDPVTAEIVRRAIDDCDGDALLSAIVDAVESEGSVTVNGLEYAFEVTENDCIEDEERLEGEIEVITKNRF